MYSSQTCIQYSDRIFTTITTRGAPIWIFADVPITDISITEITAADTNTNIYFMLQSSQIYLLNVTGSAKTLHVRVQI